MLKKGVNPFKTSNCISFPLSLGYIFPAKENEVELYANDANASRVSVHEFAQAIKRRSDPFGTSCLNL